MSHKSPDCDPARAIRVVRSAVRRHLPSFLVHWEDDVVQEAVVLFLDIERRGYCTTDRILRQVTVEAIRRLFRSTKTDVWHLKSMVLPEPPVDHPSKSGIDEQAWLRATLERRWAGLTVKQQEAVCKWVAGIDQNNCSRRGGLRRILHDPQTWKTSERDA